MSTTFILLLVLYAFHATKTMQFLTISTLGFKLEAAKLFLEHPRAYIFSRWILFFVVICTALITKWPPWYVAISATIIVGFIATFIGRRLAFNSWRRIHTFLAQDEQEPDELASIEAGAQMTNRELEARISLEKDSLSK